MAIGIGPGDEVLIPDTTFIGSATAAIMVGADPVFVDVEPETFQIDIARAAQRLTPRTRAIMPVHLFGTACDMAAVGAFAETHGLKIIEDAAQGIGVHYAGRHVGTFGDVGCFSFFADKTITTGEGGYIVCRDEAVYQKLRLLRNQGRLDRGSFMHEAVGYNFRMTDIQCAIGLVQLARLPEIIARKGAILAHYRARLDGVPGIRILGAAPNADQVAFRCVVMSDDAAGLMRHLEQGGVQPRGFFQPMHRQPGLLERSNPALMVDADFPNAIYGATHGVCLPAHATMSEADVDLVCDLVRQFHAHG